MRGTYPRKATYTGKTTRLLAEDKCFVSPSYTRDYQFIVSSGIGREVIDVDGNWYLDFGAGIAVTATGHCDPNIVAAINHQAGRLIHMSGTDFYYEPQIKLAQKLSEISGLREGMVFYGNSGAEAVEAAMKLARFYTRRPGFIAFNKAFHGRTLGALSLTASREIQSKGYLPLQPVAHVPYPNCSECWFGMEEEECKSSGSMCVKYIQEMVIDAGVMPAADCAAIVMEPIQGEGGYIVPPACWYEDINDLARKNDLLIICDEVQAGMGRTGKWFAHQHFVVTSLGQGITFRPDIITFAKGIASGMPLGGIIAEADIMKYWEPGSHASTFGGNPVSCAAALETIKIIEAEDLLRKADVRGKELSFYLRGLARSFPEFVHNPRGVGLMRAVDICGSGGDVTDYRGQVLNKCFEKGLILLGCGKAGIRFCPALNVTKEEVETCAAILQESIEEVI